MNEHTHKKYNNHYLNNTFYNDFSLQLVSYNSLNTRERSSLQEGISFNYSAERNSHPNRCVTVWALGHNDVTKFTSPVNAQRQEQVVSSAEPALDQRRC